MTALATNFRDLITLPGWRMVANALNASAVGASWCSDLRTDFSEHPLAYNYMSAAILNAYNPNDDEHMAVFNPGTGTFAAGCVCEFAPSIGPSGTLGTVTSTSVFALTTLPNSGSIGINQWANRGDYTQDNGTVQGFKIRVISNSASGTGKIGETYVVANTAGTTPTLSVSPALGFTPVAGDRWELLSGSVMMLATAATIWSRYDVALNKVIALTATNLPAAATDTAICVIDEQYTPLTQSPSKGYFGNLTATVSTNTTNATVTGTSAAADKNLTANAYANGWQIRIIEDTTNVQAVGQRLPITSHTNANPTVYTLKGTFTVAPSNTMKYVVEGVGDVIVCTGASTTVGTYGGNFAADAAFSTNATSAGGKMQIPVRAANSAAGNCMWWPFAMAVDVAGNMRTSGVYLLRGGATGTIDCLDMATLSWTTGVGGQAIVYGNSGLTTFTTGTSRAYVPWAQNGQFTYINVSGTQRFLRWDNLNRILTPYASLRYPEGAAVVGNKMFSMPFIDPTGTPLVPFVYHHLNTGVQMAQLTITR